MTDFDRWDVVTALFPFTDTNVKKPRPVLVLTDATFNRDHGHLIGSMITTGARSQWPSDYRIEHLSSTGLSHSSVVRWKIFTLPLALIGRKVGKLAHADSDEIAKSIARIIPGQP